MGRITLSVLTVISIVSAAYGMDCSFGTSENAFEQLIKSCPRPLIDGSDKSYCCINIKDESFYCCDAEEWALKTGLGIVIPAIIAVVVVISIIVLCISCLCCTCCPWYRRRHRGIVYGNLQVPGTAVHIQPSPAYPDHSRQTPIYLSNTSATPQYSGGPPPPQYVQEGYVKQAPYNPDYPKW